MVENKIKLSDSDVDELCSIMLDSLVEMDDGWTEIRSIKKRFSIEYDTADGDDVPFTLARAVQDIVYYIENNKINFYEFFIDVINRGIGDVDRHGSILKKYGYSLEYNGGKWTLVPLVGETFQKEIEEIQGFIENNASEKTLNHLKEAKEKFSKGDFDGCLSECRIALESMTKNGNFFHSVKEFANLGLIIDNNDTRRKDDGWLLNAVYGYASTVGSHDSVDSPVATSNQALMGLMITQSTVRFILEKLQESKQKNLNLCEW